MRLPPTYNARLQRYDRDLRVRWSSRRQQWLLERKARYERLTVNPDLYAPHEHDTVVQMREGYAELGSYPARELPRVDRLIAYLQSQDVWRRGDQDLDRLAHAVADELDAAYAEREQQQRAAIDSDVSDGLDEVWEHERWRAGERVAVPRALPGT